MAELLKGAPVAEALAADTAARAAALAARGVTPTLAILRVGERPDDLSYEKGAMKRCAAAGVAVKNVVLPAEVSQAALMDAIRALNEDSAVHGVLMMRPLPAPLDNEAARRALSPAKDVDGITDGSLAGVFTGSREGFAPCTALLMARGATVTICHSGTKDLAAETRRGDVVVAAIGKMGYFGAGHFAPGAVVVDVGIHFDEAIGKLRGDVRTDEAADTVKAITPVPGGLGAVTTAVLVKHVVQAAERALSRV